MDPTSDGIARIDRERRRALALLGLWGAAAYVAPVLLTLSSAHAQGEGGDGEGGDGHGGSGDEVHDGDESSGDIKTGPGGPPEAP